MQTERTPRYTPQEQTNCARTAQDLRERLQSGLLSELTSYPQFVVWKYRVEQGKLKKRPGQMIQAHGQAWNPHSRLLQTDDITALVLSSQKPTHSPAQTLMHVLAKMAILQHGHRRLSQRLHPIPSIPHQN